MKYAIWERGGREPVMVLDSRQEAEQALNDLIDDGVDAGSLAIRPHGGHAGQIFPGGIDIQLPR